MTPPTALSAHRKRLGLASPSVASSIVAEKTYWTTTPAVVGAVGILKTMIAAALITGASTQKYHRFMSASVRSGSRSVENSADFSRPALRLRAFTSIAGLVYSLHRIRKPRAIVVVRSTVARAWRNNRLIGLIAPKDPILPHVALLVPFPGDKHRSGRAPRLDRETCGRVRRGRILRCNRHECS